MEREHESPGVQEPNGALTGAREGAVERPEMPERNGALTGGREGAVERPGMQDRDADLVALEGLEAELADLDDALAQVDRAADDSPDPAAGS